MFIKADMNELLFILSIVFTFSAVLVLLKLFGKKGLFCWVCFASVMANIIVVKTVDCFGLTTTLGNVLFGSVFLSLDIINELYNKKEANSAVYLGLACNVAFIIISQFVILYKPSTSDFSSDAFIQLFSLTPRVCLGSICAYAFGNFLDIQIFDKLKSKQGSKNLWIRNNLSTITAQLFDNFVLHTIAFLGIMTFRDVCILSVNVWLIEVVIALCDTPFLYIAKHKLSNCK